MPIFHCPMGAPYYDGENCILCGLCEATTNEEQIEATKKIRVYLKGRPEKKIITQKIAVCGKGGVGKSTIVSLISNCLAEDDYKVLVFDLDESNTGLFRMFGFPQEPKPLINVLNRFAEEGPKTDSAWLAKEKIGFQDIPAEYVLKNQNLNFIMAGKISDPFQGCACLMADVTRELMGKFITQEKESVLADMEAGIESFGRGVERHVDTVLIVVEPSYESISLAGKIAYMADGIGVRKVRAILNKIPSQKIEQKIKAELIEKEIMTIGTLKIDDQIYETNFEGKPPDSITAKKSIKKIVRSLFDDLI